MINDDKLTGLPDDLLPAIQSAFELGEEGIALCYVQLKLGTAKSFFGTPDSLMHFLVLTNRYIRHMGFKTSFWKGQLKKPPVLNSVTTLRAINSIKTMESKSLSVKVLELSFSLEGKEESFIMPDGEGQAFVEKLREVVSNKDSSPAQLSMADELQKLTQLNKEGILSQEEYDRAKNRLIGVSSSQVDEATKLLRQLYDLHKQGVLSESEYNMKKWDVLSQRLIPKDKSS